MDIKTLNGGGIIGNRKELDSYSTPAEATQALLNFLQLPFRSRIWEPACGSGTMSEVLTRNGHIVVSTDIRKTGFGYSGLDFLTIGPTKTFDAIITNPPFTDADKFIINSLDKAPIVALLLKSQFWHGKKRYTLFKNNPPAWILPLTWRPDFLAETRKTNKPANPTMEVAWSVWIAGDTQTKYKPLLKP